MKLPKWQKHHLRTVLVGGIVGLFVFFAARIYNAVVGSLLAHVFPAIPNTVLLSLCSILLLTAALLGYWVRYLYHHQEPTAEEKSEAFHDQFGEFVANLGVWTHKTKPGYFCPNCKMHLRESQMLEFPQGRGWKCLFHECSYLALNPDYKAPTWPLV